MRDRAKKMRELTAVDVGECRRRVRRQKKSIFESFQRSFHLGLNSIGSSLFAVNSWVRSPLI